MLNGCHTRKVLFEEFFGGEVQFTLRRLFRAKIQFKNFAGIFFQHAFQVFRCQLLFGSQLLPFTLLVVKFQLEGLVRFFFQYAFQVFHAQFLFGSQLRPFTHLIVKFHILNGFFSQHVFKVVFRDVFFTVPIIKAHAHL